MREMAEEGYNKYSKNNLPFVLPNILTGPELILPPSQLSWLLSQPTSLLDQNEVNREFLQADYTMLHPKVIRDMVHAEVIRQEMTKDLGDYLDAVWEEVNYALEKNWGGRVSNRVLVGRELCRNEKYLYHSRKFARNVVITAGLINLLPKWLQPILARLVTYFDIKHYLACSKYILPIVQQRLASPSSTFKESNDYVTWAISHSLTHADPQERTPEMISRRLSVLSFAAIQSSSITLTNLLFDIVYSPSVPTFSILETLRTQILQCLSTPTTPSSYPTTIDAKYEPDEKKIEGRFTSQKLKAMTKLDAILKESMRLNGFVIRGVMKMVMPSLGLSPPFLPPGTLIPKGTKVGVTAWAIHRDRDRYPAIAQQCKSAPITIPTTTTTTTPPSAEEVANPRKDQRNTVDFDPFRFEKLGHGLESLVRTSEDFLAFSHGRHACPGRFFAAQQMKLVLAHIALFYEMRAGEGPRPQNRGFVGSVAPPMGE
ncbi:hypothetical protein B7494_g8525, partial [Chlorociboria aeruginascens]